MGEILRPITALLLSVAILLLGNGLQIFIVPVRAELVAFSPFEIGLAGAFYYGGLLAGCFLCPLAVAQVGHIRAFAAFAALATLAPLVHPMSDSVLVWCVLRTMTGVSFAGLYIVIESWLNGAASNENRGTVFAIYTAINLTVMAAGQLLVMTGDPAGPELFSLVAILIITAVIPVALSKAATPHQPQAARFRLRWLYRTSPVAVAGCLCTGLASGAFWSLGPVFGTGSGLGVDMTAIFMAVVILSAAAAQWPLGHLSDRRDRRHVILLAGAIALVASVGLVVGESAAMVIALGALFGLGAIPLYALSVAHGNDFADREDAVDVCSGLLLVYAIGAVVGPIVAALFMKFAGPGGLFAYTAIVYATFMGFVVLRMTRRETPAPEEREDFVAMTRTSPVVLELDPRSVPEEEKVSATIKRSRLRDWLFDRSGLKRFSRSRAASTS